MMGRWIRYDSFEISDPDVAEFFHRHRRDVRLEILQKRPSIASANHGTP